MLRNMLQFVSSLTCSDNEKTFSQQFDEMSTDGQDASTCIFQLLVTLLKWTGKSESLVHDLFDYIF